MTDLIQAQMERERVEGMKHKSDLFTEVEINHILSHLYHNKIDDPDSVSGWYCGNKKAFIKRHKNIKVKLGKMFMQGCE